MIIINDYTVNVFDDSLKLISNYIFDDFQHVILFVLNFMTKLTMA